MPLLDELELDKAPTAAEVESAMRAGPVPPEGLHHAALVGFREVQANSGSHGRELTFKILAGPGKGFEVRDTLWSPSGKSAESDGRARNRMRIFAHRLGLLKKVALPDGTTKYVAVEGKTDFLDVYGAACVIEVKHEEREYTDKGGKLKKVTDARLAFEGVLALDDDRCKAVPRGDAAAAVAAVTAPAPAADEYADL